MAIAKGYLVAACTKEDAGKAEKNQIGILSQHAYAIVATEGVKQAKLRSLYGEINGFDYNTHHKTFVMNMNDLKSNFEKIVICKLHSEYYYAACPLKIVYA